MPSVDVAVRNDALKVGEREVNIYNLQLDIRNSFF